MEVTKKNVRVGKNTQSVKMSSFSVSCFELMMVNSLILTRLRELLIIWHCMTVILRGNSYIIQASGVLSYALMSSIAMRSYTR